MPATAETPEKTAPNPSSELPPRPSMRRWFILAGVLAIAAVGSFLYYNHVKDRQETDDAQIDGRLHAVSARVGGTVLELKVKDNQFVKAGDVLLVIDSKDYQVALDSAKADLAGAKADQAAGNTQIPIAQATTASQLSSADAGVAEARALVTSAEKQVDAARARLQSVQAAVTSARAVVERNRKDLERYQALLAKDEISQQQYDATKSAVDASNAQLTSAQAQVREAEQAIQVAEATVAERRARVARADADARSTRTGPQQVAVTQARALSNAAKVQQMESAVERAELNVGYTVVKAPVSGLVSQRTVETGQVINAGQPLLAIVPLDDIWVVANFKESQLSKMRPGQKVEIHVDAYGGKTFTGKVESIAAATGARFSLLPPENSTGNYVKVVQRVPVRIEFDPNQDPEHRLRPGMSVVPSVLTDNE